jgi:hypothetical protein
MSNEPQTKKRIRRRSATLQLQVALQDAASLMRLEASDELSISRIKLAQCRLNVLAQMQARENDQKLKRAIAEIDRLKTENERLRAEPARPSAGANTVTGAVTAEINEALARYQGGQNASHV